MSSRGESESDAPRLGDAGEAPASGLSIRGLIRRTSGLSAVSLVTATLGVPTTLLAARWVGPTGYGAVQFVILAYFYAALLRTGAFDGGLREFIHETGLGNQDRARYARSVGFSWETVASTLPAVLMVPLGLLLGDTLRRLGFFMAPVAVLAASLNTMYGGMFIAEQRLGVVRRVWLVRAFALSTSVLAGITIFGPAAVFVGPVVADVVAVGLFVAARPRLHLRWVLDRSEGLRLLAAGFPFGIGAIVYWMYRMVGSSIVAFTQPTRTFGIYAFALAPVTILTRTIAMADAVLTPALWTEMAKGAGDRAWVKQSERITITLAFVAAAATNVAQAAFGPLVQLVAPSYSSAIKVFDVLSLSVYPLAIGAVVSLVVNSMLVNRQRTGLLIVLGGLIVNVVANVVTLAAGGGVVAVAWNDVWVQYLVLGALYEAAAPYLEPGRRRFALYAKLLLVASGMAAVDVLLNTLARSRPGSTSDVMAILMVRLAVVAAVWGVTAGVWGTRSRRATGAMPAAVPVANDE